jgi:hypothetical protein
LRGKEKSDTTRNLLPLSTRPRSVVVETRSKIFRVKTSGVPAGSNFFHNVSTNGIRVITGRGVVWRHVTRDEAFIGTEMETITDANRDIREFLKKPSFDEVVLPCLPAEWGNNWK